jgi:hypothetical protein
MLKLKLRWLELELPVLRQVAWEHRQQIREAVALISENLGHSKHLGFPPS